MQKLFFFAATLLVTINLSANIELPFNNLQQSPDSLNIIQADSLEYDIIIIETGYDNWILTNAQPKWYYTNEYYRQKNQFYVIDWNSRVIQSMGRPPFEEQIFYNPNTDYGLEVNYKLYWYFKFMEHKYGIRLSGGGKDSF